MNRYGERENRGRGSMAMASTGSPNPPRRSGSPPRGHGAPAIKEPAAANEQSLRNTLRLSFFIQSPPCLGWAYLFGHPLPNPFLEIHLLCFICSFLHPLSSRFFDCIAFCFFAAMFILIVWMIPADSSAPRRRFFQPFADDRLESVTEPGLDARQRDDPTADDQFFDP